MTENFIFKALFLSLSVHTAILCVSYFSRVNDPQYKVMRHQLVEVSYEIPVHKRIVDMRERPVNPSQKVDLNNNSRLFSNGALPVSLDHERPMLPFGWVFEHKPEEMRTMDLGHKVSITPIKSEKINNPVYAAYNEIVRERIKEKVYENYDQLERGSVYLTFLLDEHGVLMASQIVEEKTNASQHLQEIAIRSLRQASPFPPFLKGMNLTEYPFNIEIQYQVSDD